MKNKPLKIYLAGSWACPEKVTWRREFMKKLNKYTTAIGADPFALEKGYQHKDYFAFDLACIKAANYTVVYANKTPVTTGTAQEMLYAKLFGKTVVLIAPLDSEARIGEFKKIHFFLEECSDLVCTDFDEAIDFILNNKNKKVENLNMIANSALNYFENSEIALDAYSKKFLEA